MSTTHYLVLSAILFSLGVLGVLVRRNALIVFMCVEMMLNASNLAFVAFAQQNGNLYYRRSPSSSWLLRPLRSSWGSRSS